MGKTFVRDYDINQYLLDYLEACRYKSDGMKILVCHVVQSGGAANDKFDALLDEANKAYMEYVLAYREIVKDTADAEYQTDDYLLEVNYYTRKLRVYKKEAAVA